MKRLLFILAFVTTSVLLSAEEDGRPRLKELGDKRVERLRAGSKCMEKKGMWGFADNEDKFVISPIFAKVEPFNEHGLAFVAYTTAGKLRWTPINIHGIYLTGLEFDEPGIYDAAGFAKVVQGGKFGMIDKEGNLVVECKYPEIEEFGACYVFHGEGLKPHALVHAQNDKGCTLHTFEEGEPIVLTAAQKCGVVSPFTFELVAPFEFDAYQVVKDFFVLTSINAKKKAVYSQDKLSLRYDDVALSPDTTYVITKDMGKFGAMNFANEVLLPCELDEAPQLGADYRLFALADGSLVFSTHDKMVPLKAYDELLRDSCLKTPSRYILDTLIPHQHKQFIPQMLEIAYGTSEFEPLRKEKEAVDYALAKRLMLLSKGAIKASYYDVDLDKVVEMGYCVDRNISVDNHPAFVTAVQNGSKKGLLDVWTGTLRIPCVYDSFETTFDNHVVMKKADTLKIYDLVSEKYEIADAFDSIKPIEGYDGLMMLSKGEFKGVYDIKAGKWLLPAEYNEVEVSKTVNQAGESILVAEVTKGGVHGIYDLTAGNMVVDCIFNDILNNNLRELHVIEGAKVGVYDAYAKEYLIPCTYDEIVESCDCFYNELLHRLAVVRDDRHLGLFDLTMKKLVLPVKSFYMHVLDGYALVSNGGGYVVIDLKTRNNAFTNTFKEAKLLPDGYVIVNQSSNDTPECGLFNLNTRTWIFEAKPNLRISDLGSSYIGYHGQEEAGIVDYKDGRWICRTDGASDIQLVSERFAVITADHNFLKGIYDIVDRAWILNQEYEEVTIRKAPAEDGTLQDRYAVVVNMYSKYGLMDLLNKDFVLGSLYETLELKEKGVAVVSRGEQKGVFDIISKNWIVPLTDQEFNLTYNGSLLDVKVGFEPVSKYDLKTRGPQVLPDYSLPFTVEALDESCVAESGLLMVSRSGKWGIYDTIKKSLVVPCDFLKIEPMYKR